MLIHILLAALTLVPGAVVSEPATDAEIPDPVCYYHRPAPGVVPKCIDGNILLLHGQTWCNEAYKTIYGSWMGYSDPMGSGTAQIGKISVFATKEDCFSVFRKIVFYCNGDNWSGGVWSGNGTSLNVNLCDW